ncbi:transposable element Tcb2 transposase [Trichonephila clavipes]|nr:transposable element Tcb2 transposase [Trichonephila clavipes]
MTSCNHVLPLMQRLPVAIFQQDNNPPHTARVSQDFLRTVTILPWPALSPSLSLIEHIWDHLGQRVRPPTSFNELDARIQIQILRESAGIYSGIWVRRSLNPVSCKSLFYGMADRRVCMLGSRSLLLDKRWQASRRSFEAGILTSRKVFSE